MWSAGGTHGLAGMICRWSSSRGSWMAFLMAFVKQLLGSAFLFHSSPRHCSPSHSLPLSCAAHEAVLWVGKKEVARTHTAGKIRCSLICALFLFDKSMGQQGLSWQFVHPRESDTGKARLLLLTSSVYPISGFFFAPLIY